MAIDFLSLGVTVPAASLSDLLRETKLLGHDSAAANPTELFAKTVHDVRGGGLSLLLARLQFAHIDGWKIEIGRTIFFLTRDHLKIMRNALLGLDDAHRALDLEPKLHGTGLSSRSGKTRCSAAVRRRPDWRSNHSSTGTSPSVASSSVRLTAFSTT